MLSITSVNSVATTPQSFITPVKTRPQYHVVGQDKQDENIDHFIQNLNLGAYRILDEEEKTEHLNNVDALELFQVTQEISRELAVVKLENHVLTDFLEKNDPRMLVGLRRRLSTASTSHRRPTVTSTSVGSGPPSGSNVRRSSSRRSLMTTQSMFTTGSIKKTTVDYRLNYKAKTDMAEKACTDVERRIRQLELKSMHDIKLLNARVEELRFRSAETDETAKNFQLHFLSDARDIAFLEKATEKQLERKFRKFVNNWNKNARALLGTMRLRITSLQESCQQHRTALITKADLSGILGAVDFEQLKIKKNEYQKQLDEKNTHMAGLKGVTGKASLAMAEEKQEMMNIEEKSKKISNKIVEVVKAIGKLEKEAKYVDAENVKAVKMLEDLKEQVGRFDAPSVNQYIEQKDELAMLEKEEKMLHRKLYILHMKVNNIAYKCKRMEAENLY